jgi:hypothetical protein
MRRLMVPLAALLALPLYSSPSFAQTQSPTPKPATTPATKSPSAKLHRVSGEVVSTDETAKTMILKETRGNTPVNVTFAVAEGAAPTLSQLKAGDRVKVSYTMMHGKRTAETIVKTENKT